ncbi:hypothetical protein NDA16_000789 [Ustilago loliicola]|nr:hypothetical protein NDA16_004597 [Ustilago loliicola]KAJ1026248.1 hypothetical protein NDA16_002335 [Ustilago loliicola]KAJ1027650.1 hypothetical protein NDA16_001989 [Ustilago loliicola]KAJ1032770.1 hypothetical protein NDA16_000789 [Ustilago loliicola]
MKIQAVLLASAAAMFASADLVAGEWLKNSPGQSYADYCGPNAGKETYYICFRSKTSILKEFQSDSSFQGYFAPDLKDKLP